MHQVLEWLRANPAVVTLIVLPMFGALFTWLSKARTAEELAKLGWFAHVVVVFRIVFPDTRALLAWVAFVLTKQPSKNLPDIVLSQSLPPPPPKVDP